MSEYIISTESTCDLPMEKYKENNIIVHPLKCTMDGETFNDGEMDYKDFYDKLVAGSMPTTSQANAEEVMDKLRPVLAAGKDVLHISFSSGLSGTYQSICIAKNDLEEEFPDRKIIVIDSLSASLGQGLLVLYAAKKKAEGMSIDELAAWVEENKLRIQHNFTVDDLMHLYRGGRVSKGTAVIGGALGIKPVMHMDDEGHLTAVGKERGRKKSLIAICKNLASGVKNCENENTIITICHSDCLEEAQFCQKKIEEYLGDYAANVEFVIYYIGTVIGSHTGKGTVGVFSIGNGRAI